MSEESDDANDPNIIVVHRLTWRSTGTSLSLECHCDYTIFTDLNTFLNKLDERYDAKVKKQGMLMAKKVRRIGCLSSSVPPPEAAAWTIDKDWKQVSPTC